MNTAQTIDPAPYIVHPITQPNDDRDDDMIIAQALAILFNRMRMGPLMDSPQVMRDYLTVRHAGLGREQFDIVYLDSQHRLIVCETMSIGTLTQTSVYPREVVKRCLELQAAAVVLAHNHPSGNARPSRADELLTQTLKSALALVDVRVLDHIITAGGASVSMAEMGLV